MNLGGRGVSSLPRSWYWCNLLIVTTSRNGNTGFLLIYQEWIQIWILYFSSLFYFSTGLSIVNMFVYLSCVSLSYKDYALLFIEHHEDMVFFRDFSAVSHGKLLHNYRSRWLRTKLLLWEQIHSPIPCWFLPPSPCPPSVSLFKTGYLWTQICSPLPFKVIYHDHPALFWF